MHHAPAHIGRFKVITVKRTQQDVTASESKERPIRYLEQNKERIWRLSEKREAGEVVDMGRDLEETKTRHTAGLSQSYLIFMLMADMIRDREERSDGNGHW